jgi:hypothetical protein
MKSYWKHWYSQGNDLCPWTPPPLRAPRNERSWNVIKYWGNLESDHEFRRHLSASPTQPTATHTTPAPARAARVSFPDSAPNPSDSPSVNYPEPDSQDTILHTQDLFPPRTITTVTNGASIANRPVAAAAAAAAATNVADEMKPRKKFRVSELYGGRSTRSILSIKPNGGWLNGMMMVRKPK